MQLVLLQCWDFVTRSVMVGFLTQHHGVSDGGGLKQQHCTVLACACHLIYVSYPNYRYIKSCTKHNYKEIDNNIHTLRTKTFANGKLSGIHANIV